MEDFTAQFAVCPYDFVTQHRRLRVALTRHHYCNGGLLSEIERP